MPSTVHEVQTIVKSNYFTNVRVTGSRHTFNNIADTLSKGARTAHINLQSMTDTHFSTCEEGPIVKFGAGCTYSQLIKAVHNQGNLAIENLPSLPHINVVGSMLTATHGSGHKYQVLTSKIWEFDMVLADGTLKTFNKKLTADFDKYLLNFGSIGVITSMSILLVPKFMVHKSIYQNLQWDVLF